MPDSEVLSKNFRLTELTRSYQADRHGIVNCPTSENVESLRNLCVKVLQPLRDFYKKPIVVSSGFRCKALNRIVGGSPSSQHLRGEAADVVFPNLDVALDWMHFVAHNCDYDQMLLERNMRSGSMWLHLSCCTAARNNRHQIRIIQV